MTTVGYGDVYPKSYGGRILGTFMCLWGVLLVSLFVVTISDILEFDNSERNSYILIKRLVYKNQLKKAAARLISSMYKFRLINQHLSKRMSGNKFLDSKSDQRKIEKAHFSFRINMLAFKTKNLEKRQFEESNELVFLFKNVDNVGEKLEEIEIKQKMIKRKQVKIFAAIKLLCDIDEHLKNIAEDKENCSVQNDEDDKKLTESEIINPNRDYSPTNPIPITT